MAARPTWKGYLKISLVNIPIKVLAIDGGKVRIGITAPKEVVMDREEFHKKRKNLLE